MVVADHSKAEIRHRLELFSGGTGGLDSLLVSDQSDGICERLTRLGIEGLSCSQLNQLLTLAHQPALSEGFFRYYWLTFPKHTYDVTRLPDFHESYNHVDQILSLDQLCWGLYRFYVDSLLYFGTIYNGYRELRTRDFTSLTTSYEARRYQTESMIHRGAPLPLNEISQDDRYLIAEQACKSFEPAEVNDLSLLMILKGAWLDHIRNGGGRVTAGQLLKSAYVFNTCADRQQQFLFAADDILESTVESEEELIEKYNSLANSFTKARNAALRNTDLYLSMANDLDVYVATSMRTRQHFRELARTCDLLFSHDAVKPLNLRFFDPTLSAARGHEDKGLIECLMVKCAKVLIYTAGDRDSYGKDAEAAMALSLGKPVIFLCNEEGRHRFFKEVHPLSRLIDFQTGVAVGVMATSSLDDAALLLSRIFENSMRYELKQAKKGYFRLHEQLTGSTVRLQTNDVLLRETFWNCYHRPAAG